MRGESGLLHRVQPLCPEPRSWPGGSLLPARWDLDPRHDIGISDPGLAEPHRLPGFPHHTSHTEPLNAPRTFCTLLHRQPLHKLVLLPSISHPGICNVLSPTLSPGLCALAEHRAGAPDPFPTAIPCAPFSTLDWVTCLHRPPQGGLYWLYFPAKAQGELTCSQLHI